MKSRQRPKRIYGPNNLLDSLLVGAGLRPNHQLKQVLQHVFQLVSGHEGGGAPAGRGTGVD